jgi:hypothetical protein
MTAFWFSAGAIAGVLAKYGLRKKSQEERKGPG